MADVLMPLSSSKNKFDDKHLLSTSEFDRGDKAGRILDGSDPPEIRPHPDNQQQVYGLESSVPDPKALCGKLAVLRSDIHRILGSMKSDKFRVKPQSAHQSQTEQPG